MQEKIIDLINELIRNFSNISNDEHMISLIEQISDIIITALDNENKLLLCGNGGSAADAQHILIEMIKLGSDHLLEYILKCYDEILQYGRIDDQ